MKRIFKLKLELVVTALFSIIVAFILAGIIKNNGVGVYNQSKNYRVERLYSTNLRELENELKNNINSKSKLEDIINKEYATNYFYSFYIADSDGKVIITNNGGVINITRNEIISGKRDYLDLGNRIYKITGCDYLDNGIYLYYVYLGYGQDDSQMMFWALIGFIIIFLFFIWGRVAYITKIKTAVITIAEGNLNHRVPLKYKDELRELSEGINFMASQLEKEEHRKNEFLTNISHDLKTPLTTILGYIDMIKKQKYDTKEELDKYIDILERKGVFLHGMLEDFFQYSKLTSKDIEINLLPIEMNELARQIYEDEARCFEEGNLAFELSLAKEPIYIKADPELLIRAINNLLNNALKYSKEKTKVRLQISKEKEQDKFFTVLSVINYPKDVITNEEVQDFFERLYKKDKARHEQGSGLGLSIVKDIVKLHKGIVKGSKEGEELVFKIFMIEEKEKF